nr:MAG TPA: hypothetical protein [Caudoviricetes sp.]
MSISFARLICKASRLIPYNSLILKELTLWKTI